MDNLLQETGQTLIDEKTRSESALIDRSTTPTYGKKAKNGVIIITTK